MEDFKKFRNARNTLKLIAINTERYSSKCFYPAKLKHYLEHYVGAYFSQEEAMEIMNHMGYCQNKDGLYKLKPIKSCEINWA